MPRPDRLVVVAGTGTEVGKTFVASAVIDECRGRGVRVAARKPAQSFAPGSGPTDADVLATAAGDDPRMVCPSHRWYAVPMAPPMAAAALGEPPFTIADLVRELVWPAGTEVGVAETAGGTASPLADDGDSAAFVAAVEPDVVVLVSDAGLGTIHAVRAAVATLEKTSGAQLAIHLNRFDEHDDLHLRNRDWLTTRDGFTVTTDVSVLARRFF
jgi:dethiobiotin synthetase